MKLVKEYRRIYSLWQQQQARADTTLTQLMENH